jgi:hypothetical protein
MQGIPQNQQNQSGSQKPTLSWNVPPAKPATPTVEEKQKILPAAPQPVAKTTVPAAAMSRNRLYGGVFLGLVVIALLVWAYVGRSSGTASHTNTEANATTGTTTQSMGGTVDFSVESQPAGGSVTVSNVHVSQPTWIVVYDDMNGTIGRALGAKLFYPISAGGESAGAIELLRNTVPGTSYLVGERIDNGDATLSFATDKPVYMNGTQVVVSFTAR